MKRTLLSAVLVAMSLVGTNALAKEAKAKAPPARQAQNFDNVEIHVLPVRDNIYMLVGAGGNITVQVGKDGVLLVDTQFAALSDKILAAIRKLSDGSIRYILNTHYHPDHVGGNVNIRAAGSTITGGNVAMDIGDAAQGAQIIAHDNVLQRLSMTEEGKEPAIPAAGWPTSTFTGELRKLYFNGEGIEMMHMPAAHTDGDSIVFFRRSDVISTGDVFVTTGYPYIDVPAGGTLQGLIDATDRLVDLIVPVYGQEGGTLLIPGHGRLSELGDLLNYREMLIVIRDRLQDMINKGMTIDQVKAAKPTFDYDPVWGSTTGFWTTDKFIEAAYKTLSAKQD